MTSVCYPGFAGHAPHRSVSRLIFRLILPVDASRLPNPTRHGDGMRILVEPSDYTFRNLGDLTLLRAAVSRLAGLWPNAAIKVMTDVPDELRAFCPEARPVLSVGRRHWLENENIWEHVRLKHISSSPRYRISQFAKVAWRYRVRRAPNDLRPLKEFKECVELA